MKPRSFSGFLAMNLDLQNNVYLTIPKHPLSVLPPPEQSGPSQSQPTPMLSRHPAAAKCGEGGLASAADAGKLRTKKKKRRRRKIDIQESLRLYAERIMQGPLANDLHELEGAYLSTFQIFSTETESRRVHSNNAFILMDICREMGVEVKGVTSECKIGGEYRASLLPGDSRETAKIVYVGNYNYFTKHPESKWSIKPCDKVYEGYL